ncbi:MAG: inositol-3-phosphate synthase [Candidatus Marinimicrobia bacterium]|nr:inositol-3-phosphate synthase [Bacteroidota bacterium]MBL7047740.1 inositol-3-phosphate synthase [Candidatus Neomarinimicrobiota bacterium]
MNKKIKIAIVGVGNCAHSLVAGIEWYKNFYKAKKENERIPGLVHELIAGYTVIDIEIVAAFDVDKRKVGKDISEAIFAETNMAYDYGVLVPNMGVTVHMGPVLDGVPEHLANFPPCPVEISDEQELSMEEVVNVLTESKAEILLNFLPTGSKKAARFYADAAIKKAKIGFFNGMPEMIVCDPDYQKAASENNVPIVGDDCKSQFGGTAINRAIAQLMKDKGIDIQKMYQINYAGNTDFYNLCHRGASKHKTKQEGVTSLIDYSFPMDTGFTHIKLMRDRKTMYLWVDGANFGNAPLHLEAKLEVEDSPNFAGVIVDVVRYIKVALDRKIGGVLESPSMYFAKHPPKQLPDAVAREMLDEFVAGKRTR